MSLRQYHPLADLIVVAAPNWLGPLVRTYCFWLPIFLLSHALNLVALALLCFLLCCFRLACSILSISSLVRSLLSTAKIISGKSGIRIVFRKAFLPLQALKSYLQPPVVPGESQSVNQVLA